MHRECMKVADLALTLSCGSSSASIAASSADVKSKSELARFTRMRSTCFDLGIVMRLLRVPAQHHLRRRDIMRLRRGDDGLGFDVLSVAERAVCLDGHAVRRAERTVSRLGPTEDGPRSGSRPGSHRNPRSAHAGAAGTLLTPAHRPAPSSRSFSSARHVP